MGKLLIISGVILIVIGIIVILLPNNISLGKLPGDIRIEREGFKFYFPITSTILISVLLTIILYLVNKFS